MSIAVGRGGGRLYPLVKRAAFAVLRARQGVHLYEAGPPELPLRLRVLHVGDPFRCQDLMRRLCGTRPVRRSLGGGWVGPLPGEFDSVGSRPNLIVVEINRLYARRYRRAGYFTLPEWVEFGRDVVADPQARYCGARKSLKSDLKAVRAIGYEAVVSRRPEDFRSYYDEMYRPYLAMRFGDGTIAKSARRLLRDFEAGFLLVLLHGGQPVAGATVRIDGDRLSETTFGVRAGADEFLRSRASAALDYHVHEWAAQHQVRFVNVGHTRPFPEDGIYFNKRKWLNSVYPDGDGVLDHAVRWVGAEQLGHEVLARCPFVCEVESGLAILAVHPRPRPMSLEETTKAVRQYWTDGLRVVLLVCPGGYGPGTAEAIRDIHGPQVVLHTRLGQAVAEYRKGIRA